MGKNERGLFEIMEKNIILYEPQCKKTEHLMFNKSILIMIKKIYTKSDIYFFGEENQIRYLKKEVDLKNYMNLNYDNNNKIKKIFNEIKNLFKIKKESNEKTIIIFLSVTPLTIIFSKIFLRKIKKLYIYHSVLEVLLKKKNILNLNFWLKPAIYMKDLNHKNLVLGEIIKKNLIKKVKKIENSVYSLDHPYIFSEMINIKREFDSKIKLAIIGYASPSKGSHKIFELEKKIMDKKNKELQIIGKISEDLEVDENSSIKIHSRNKPLSPEIFSKLVSDIDYGLYFYSKDSYKLFASGAIFDCISHLKPIIAIKNDYFEYIFKKFGDIGYLLESEEEMYIKIREILENPNLEKYKIQQKNILEGRRKFTIDFLKNELEAILNF